MRILPNPNVASALIVGSHSAVRTLAFGLCRRSCLEVIPLFLFSLAPSLAVRTFTLGELIHRHQMRVWTWVMATTTLHRHFDGTF